MPSFRKLSPPETASPPPPLSARAQVAQAYDAHLAGFAIGDHGRAELIADERRDLVRQRLHAAARRRGLVLRFRPGPGAALIFGVEPLPIVDAALAAAVLNAASAPSAPPPFRVQTPPRRQRQERRPAGRYDDVLPRWMREGAQPGRRDKRRTK